jgi:glutamate 5-kinase
MVDIIQQAKRIVIKIGSSLLTDESTGALKKQWLSTLIENISDLCNQDKEVIIVTSGSIAIGRKLLKVTNQKLKLEEKQAAAACGQIELLSNYKEIFAKKDIEIAQILLTIEDSEDRRRYLNARNTLETLIRNKVIPIINENDTVATTEIRFGDNDRLAARVAQMVNADLLIIFSDIDGLYTANPNIDSNAKLIEKVENITSVIENMAGDSTSKVGTGGMITKIAAAKIATSSGCHMVIAKGKIDHPIRVLEKNNRFTWFVAGSTPIKARKNWIAHSLNISGNVVINACAIEALKEGNSLLPVGVVKVSGNFNRGDKLRIVDEDGKEIGVGISAYSFSDAEKIIGKKTLEIANILGFYGREELIHRDDLVVNIY